MIVWSFMTIVGFLGTIAPVAGPVSLCSIVELNENYPNCIDLVSIKWARHSSCHRGSVRFMAMANGNDDLIRQALSIRRQVSWPGWFISRLGLSCLPNPATLHQKYNFSKIIYSTTLRPCYVADQDQEDRVTLSKLI